MNCDDCKTPSTTKRNREVALKKLRLPKAISTKEEDEAAISCLQCAADKLADDAERRRPRA